MTKKSRIERYRAAEFALWNFATARGSYEFGHVENANARKAAQRAARLHGKITAWIEMELTIQCLI